MHRFFLKRLIRGQKERTVFWLLVIIPAVCLVSGCHYQPRYLDESLESSEGDILTYELTDGEGISVQKNTSFIIKVAGLRYSEGEFLRSEANSEGECLYDSKNNMLAKGKTVGNAYLCSQNGALFFIVETTGDDGKTLTWISKRRQMKSSIEQAVFEGEFLWEMSGINVGTAAEDKVEGIYLVHTVNTDTLASTNSYKVREGACCITAGILKASESMDEAVEGYVTCLIMPGVEAEMTEYEEEGEGYVALKINENIYWMSESQLAGEDCDLENIAYKRKTYSLVQEKISDYVIFPEIQDDETEIPSRLDFCVGIVFVQDSPIIIVQDKEGTAYRSWLYRAEDSSYQQIVREYKEGYYRKDEIYSRLLEQRRELSGDTDEISYWAITNNDDISTFSSEGHITLEGETYYFLDSLHLVKEKEDDNDMLSMGSEYPTEQFIQGIWTQDDEAVTSRLSTGEEIQNVLYVNNVIEGSFTSAGEEEYLVIFKFVDAPSREYGLDRTIIAVFDEDTMEIKVQQTFAYDDVQIKVMHNDEKNLDDFCAYYEILKENEDVDHDWRIYTFEECALMEHEILAQ